MENNKLFMETLIGDLFVSNDKTARIKIYLNPLKRDIIFKCLIKTKLDGHTTWHLFSKKIYNIDEYNTKDNFEKMCKEVYKEAKSNLEFLETSKAFLKDVTEIEIKEID